MAVFKIAGFLYLASGLSLAVASEINVSSESRTTLDVTLYGGGFAQISEKRTLKTQKGVNTYALSDVSRQIAVDTVQLGAKSLQIMEFGYDQNELNQRGIYNAYRGKEVLIETTHPQTGEVKRQKAKVLDGGNGSLLEMDGLIYSTPPGRLVFPGLPEGLRSKQSLTLMASAQSEGETDLSLSYLTRGFGWRTNYVAVLNENGTSLELSARANLQNQSGMDLEGATLTLIAGQVNAPRQNERVMVQSEPRAMKAMAMADGVMEAAPRQSFGERHLYKLPGKRSLKTGQSKQVTLFDAPEVKAERKFVFQGGIMGGYQRQAQEQKARLEVVFKNQKADGLGLPLPSGAMNTYQKDAGGNLRYIGQSNLGDIAIGKEAKVNLGQAFDVSLKRTQKTFKRFGPKNRNFESDWQLEVFNGQDKDVAAVIEENMFGDWKVMQSSHEVSEKTAQHAVWMVKIPAKGKTTLTYRVSVQNR